MPEPMPEKLQAAYEQCRQFDLNLGAYLEGEARPEVATHALECRACGGLLADMKLIISEAPMVLLEDPPARLWANVRATLEQEGIFREPSPGWFGWFPQLAQPGLIRFAAPFSALAFMALVGVLFLGPRRVDQVPITNRVDQVPVANNVPNGAMEQTVSQMEASYRSREKSLDPAVQASYQKGLRSLDNSIREFRDSVNKEPSNPVAQEYLANAYEQKAAVLSAALEYDGH
jgi:hypothetical protein